MMNHRERITQVIKLSLKSKVNVIIVTHIYMLKEL